MVSRVLFALVAVACAHAGALDVIIGANGAAGIVASTPMNRDAIAAAAPGYVVEEGETVSGERRFARFTLSANGEVVFNIYPAADRSAPTGIGTRSAQARGPRGETIGATRFRDTSDINRDTCRPAMPHERFTFSCADATGHFWRAYQAAASYKGPRETFADISADVADAAVLAQMYWVAPSAATD
ncbi:hypothetical protein [Terricaulis silvestris]|uniref:Uncharacterized protein n=1 Tax=Terricaulis silvestris TaxID=2686094 RepID=A0A6I6MK12_9CAUL|nr:hypothetical protein [Terricaulis silvestris]QGZ94261.1 hypothetical protein DSM104635_01077 [Terricaulis silvestris]